MMNFLRLARLPESLRHGLALLFFLLIPVACAASCGTSSAVATGAHNRVNLETFVPDPICWLQNTQQKVVSFGLYGWSKDIAIGIIVVAIGTAALGAALNQMEFFRKLVIGAICFGMISSYGSGGGAWLLTTAIDDAWNAGYSASAKGAQGMLNQNVLQDAKNLGTKFETYLADTAHLKVLEKGMKVAALLPTTNTASLDATYQQVVKGQDLNSTPTESNPLWGNAAGIVYFLLLGLFTVFGIMVYSSGFLILAIGVLVPIIVATCAFGNFTPVMSVGKLGIGAVAGIILLPLTVGLMTDTLLTSPIQTLNNSLDYSIQQSTASIGQFKGMVDQCYHNLNLADCAKSGYQVVSIESDIAGTLQDAVLGLGLGVMAIFAAFAVAMSQIRRVPALVMQVMGSAGGGGESSGAYTPSASGMASSAQGAAGKVAGAALDVAAAASTGGGSLAAKAAVAAVSAATTAKAKSTANGPKARDING